MAKMTTRRKLAIASWSAPREGNIYGKVTVDATEALRYLAWVRETSGEKVSVTHLVGKAVAAALAAEPSLNGYLRFGSYHRHDSVDVAFLVALEDGSDLAKAKIEHLDRKSMAEVGKELRDLAGRIRAGEDSEFEASKGLIRLMPTWLLRRVVWLTGWLTSSMGVNAKPAGLSKFPFGSCIVTSVGMFGLDEAFVPPTPFARVPIYVLVGAIREQPTVVDGKLVVRPLVTVTATIDHRFIDGFQGGILAREFRRVFDDPWSLEGMDGPPAAKAAPRKAAAKKPVTKVATRKAAPRKATA